MVVLRVLGLVLVALAIAAAGWEALAAWQGGGWRPLALGEMWFRLHAASLNAAQAGIQRHIAPWLWEPGITTILRWPAWVVFAVPGAVLLWVGRPRKRRPAGRIG
jgi:hypothetical protein